MNTKTFKMNRATCKTDHAGRVPDKKIAALPESQAGAARHRCAHCAYEMGYRDAIEATKHRIVSAVMDADEVVDKKRAVENILHKVHRAA